MISELLLNYDIKIVDGYGNQGKDSAFEYGFSSFCSDIRHQRQSSLLVLPYVDTEHN